ncbi:hypothetical protein HDU93_000413 [Gonapodya sp. JEL0774]|nr:hypothetical protein HDU93_000413 [Gonapodya sp. JEL0774]
MTAQDYSDWAAWSCSIWFPQGIGATTAKLPPKATTTTVRTCDSIHAAYVAGKKLTQQDFADWGAWSCVSWYPYGIGGTSTTRTTSTKSTTTKTVTSTHSATKTRTSTLNRRTTTPSTSSLTTALPKTSSLTTVTPSTSTLTTVTPSTSSLTTETPSTSSVTSTTAIETTTSWSLSLTTTDVTTTTVAPESTTLTPTTTKTKVTSTTASGPCTVTAYNGFAGCMPYTDITIQGPFTVPSETTISMATLKPDTKVKLQGTITFNKSNNLGNGNFLFTIAGSNIVFDGSEGTFEGNGPLYWDGLGANGGVPKPKFFRAKLTGNSVVRGITIHNSPVHVFSVAGAGTVFEDIKIDNSDGFIIGSNGLELGHNTDAFDVGANDIVIRNSYIRNQDDCIAINSGNNITFVNNYCYGGHGISIGSVNTNQIVSNVYVGNCTVEAHLNGLRIKTVVGATGGYVSNVIYKDITLIGITGFGIVIQQDYLNGGPTGNPSGGIPISNVSYTNVQGTLAPGANNSVYILCYPGACSGFSFTNVFIQGTPNCTGYAPLPDVCLLPALPVTTTEISTTSTVATTTTVESTTAITTSATATSTDATTTIQSFTPTTTKTTKTATTTVSGPCTVTAWNGFAACMPYTDITIQGPFTVPAETKISMATLRPGTVVKLRGTVTFAKSETLNSTNYLFTIAGSDVLFDGTGGTFEGNGPLYWDGIGANGGVPKPKMFRSTLTGNSIVRGITIHNSPVHIFSVGGSGTTFEGITVDNSDGFALGPDGLELGHNTDAFGKHNVSRLMSALALASFTYLAKFMQPDVSADNITIRNNFVRNQDDCLAINRGNNVTFINNYCYGGHGVSIGSIKDGQVVTNVYIANCTVEAHLNGLRIKTVVGATGGYVSNVIYKDITLIGITGFGIVIQQDYLNGGPTGNPSGGIPISNVSYTNVQGTLAPGANNSVYILCYPGACSGFSFTNVFIQGTPNCTGYAPLPDVCLLPGMSSTSDLPTPTTSVDVTTFVTTIVTSTATAAATTTATITIAPSLPRPLNLPANAIVVSQDGTGDFTSIQPAIDSIPSPNTQEVVVYIKSGNYSTSQIFITKDFVTLVGDGWDKTTISYFLNNPLWSALNPGQGGASFESATVRVKANYFKAFDIRFENTGPVNTSSAQAPAFYMRGDNSYIENCYFVSWQDTLLSYTGTNQLFNNVYVFGDVDFVWGYGRAMFQNSQFHVGNRAKRMNGTDKTRNGYVVANGADPKSADKANSWFWLYNSSISADDNVNVYLGRPWGTLSAATFQGLYMPASVVPAGFIPMSSGAPNDTNYFEVVGTNSGPGADVSHRLSYVHQTMTGFTLDTFFNNTAWLKSVTKYGISVNQGVGYFQRCCTNQPVVAAPPTTTTITTQPANPSTTAASSSADSSTTDATTSSSTTLIANGITTAFAEATTNVITTSTTTVAEIFPTTVAGITTSIPATGPVTLPQNVPSSAIVVAQDGSGNFRSIQPAIDSIPASNTQEVVVYIRAGNYSDSQITIFKDHVTLVGDGWDKTTISYYLNNPLWQALNPGASSASFESATVRVKGNYFKAFDIRFENTAPLNASAVQAPAFYFRGDNSYIENCHFISWQDTLLSYYGTNHWFNNIYVFGDVDFVWGYGRAIFQNAQFHVGNRAKRMNGTDKIQNGYVVANGATPSPATRANSWFWIYDSSISADPNTNVYLARSWGTLSAATFQNVYMPSSVVPIGFIPMSSTAFNDSNYWEVVGTNSGPGADVSQRPSWVHQTTTGFTLDTFFNNTDWLKSVTKYGISVNKGPGYFQRCCTGESVIPAPAATTSFSTTQ